MLTKNIHVYDRNYLFFFDCMHYSVPARKFYLRAKVAPTTHFWGPDISRKGQCTSISLICKREETVGKFRKWKWQLFEAQIERPFLYTIEEIFGNKANSTTRMYAIKIVSNFFHLIFHFTVKICFHSLILNIHFFVTYWEKTFDRPQRCVCQVYPFSIPMSFCDITKATSQG